MYVSRQGTAPLDSSTPFRATLSVCIVESLVVFWNISKEPPSMNAAANFELAPALSVKFSLQIVSINTEI